MSTIEKKLIYIHKSFFTQEDNHQKDSLKEAFYTLEVKFPENDMRSSFAANIQRVSEFSS